MAQYDHWSYYLLYILISMTISVYIISVVVRKISIKDAFILVLSRFVFMFFIGFVVGLAVKYIDDLYLLVVVVAVVAVVFIPIFEFILNKIMAVKITLIEIIIIFIKECAVILIFIIIIALLYISLLFLL